LAFADRATAVAIGIKGATAVSEGEEFAQVADQSMGVEEALLGFYSV
jgi:hypothetical protein